MHEALAIEPRTKYVYQTEERARRAFTGSFPRAANDLRTGRLQMLAIEGQPSYDARSGEIVGVELPVTWVDIDEADPPAGTPAVSNQGFAKGGAIFRRLEGAWYSKTTP